MARGVGLQQSFMSPFMAQLQRGQQQRQAERDKQQNLQQNQAEMQAMFRALGLPVPEQALGKFALPVAQSQVRERQTQAQTLADRQRRIEEAKAAKAKTAEQRKYTEGQEAFRDTRELEQQIEGEERRKPASKTIDELVREYEIRTITGTEAPPGQKVGAVRNLYEGGITDWDSFTKEADKAETTVTFLDSELKRIFESVPNSAERVRELEDWYDSPETGILLDILERNNEKEFLRIQERFALLLNISKRGVNNPVVPGSNPRLSR